MTSAECLVVLTQTHSTVSHRSCFVQWVHMGVSQTNVKIDGDILTLSLLCGCTGVRTGHKIHGSWYVVFRCSKKVEMPENLFIIIKLNIYNYGLQ